MKRLIIAALALTISTSVVGATRRAVEHREQRVIAPRATMIGVWFSGEKGNPELAGTSVVIDIRTAGVEKFQTGSTDWRFEHEITVDNTLPVYVWRYRDSGDLRRPRFCIVQTLLVPTVPNTAYHYAIDTSELVPNDALFFEWRSEYAATVTLFNGGRPIYGTLTIQAPSNFALPPRSERYEGWPEISCEEF